MASATTPTVPDISGLNSDPTFNQFLQNVLQLPVSPDNLAKLGGLLGKKGSKTSRVPLDRINEAVALFSSNGSSGSHKGSQPSAEELLSQAAQAATPADAASQPPEATGIPAAALLQEYAQKGLTGISLGSLVSWVPAVRGDADRLTPESLIGAENELELRNTLEALLAVTMLLAEDRQALQVWAPPHPEDLTGKIYRYRGICGHDVETRGEAFERRLNSDNARQTPLLRLCPECLAVRIALLDRIPGSAAHDSLCTVCGEAMFNSGSHGWTLSRGDIWENLLSGVGKVAKLPRRLAPRHPDTDPRHVERDKTLKQFLAWREHFRREVGILVAQNPSMAKELMAGMHQSIKERATELGLEIDNDNDNSEGDVISHA